MNEKFYHNIYTVGAQKLNLMVSKYIMKFNEN